MIINVVTFETIEETARRAILVVDFAIRFGLLDSPTVEGLWLCIEDSESSST